jgi:hypothetical protein
VATPKCRVLLLKLNLILPSRLFCLALLGIIEYGFHLYGMDSLKSLRRRERREGCIDLHLFGSSLLATD